MRQWRVMLYVGVIKDDTRLSRLSNGRGKMLTMPKKRRGNQICFEWLDCSYPRKAVSRELAAWEGDVASRRV